MTEDYTSPIPVCEYPGCQRPRRNRSHRWCSSHSRQWYAAGRDDGALTPLRVWAVRDGCGFEGCDRPYKTSGLCSGHLAQFYRSGKDRSALRPIGTVRNAKWGFAGLAAGFEGKECLLWPFRKDRGYAVVRPPGSRKWQRVSRLVLERTVGPPPAGKPFALHDPLLCSTPACVNPAHLRWGSELDNAGDKELEGAYVFGERHHSAKLSDAEVAAICFAEAAHADLAEEYGVSVGYVRGLRAGTVSRARR